MKTIIYTVVSAVLLVTSYAAHADCEDAEPAPDYSGYEFEADEE